MRTGARAPAAPTRAFAARHLMNAWACSTAIARKQLARAFVHRGALEAVDGWHATSDEEAAEIKGLVITSPFASRPTESAGPVDSERVREADYWLKNVGGRHAAGGFVLFAIPPEKNAC